MRRDKISQYLRGIGVTDLTALEEHRKMLSRICPNDPEKYKILGNPNNIQPINIAMG